MKGATSSSPTQRCCATSYACKRPGAPASIRVQAQNLEVEILGGGRARAKFYQHYATDQKNLYTWKTMELERLEEGWRIVSERAGR